jgi:hypothetical protein
MKEYIPLDILEKRQIERRIEDLQRVVETNKTDRYGGNDAQTQTGKPSETR